ncbi:MAG: response regulator, partial [Candidatus Dormibacteraceae bacterium]
MILVDDHPLFRAGLRTALDSADGIEVVAEADDGEQALAQVCELEPELVVMDLHLPGKSGIETIRELTRNHPIVRVLVLTMSEDDDALIAALRAGAKGYMVKGVGREELLHAVRTVGIGGTVFFTHTAEQLAGLLSAGVGVNDGQVAFPALTTRERQILDLLARGYDNRRLARELTLSDKTIRNHVSNLFAKLHVANRAEAIVKARDAGLG